MSEFGFVVPPAQPYKIERLEGPLRLAVERARLLYYYQQVQHLVEGEYNTVGRPIASMQDHLLIKGIVTALADINEQLCKVFVDVYNAPNYPKNQLLHDFEIVRSYHDQITRDNFIYERRHVYRQTLYKIIRSGLITPTMMNFYVSLERLLLVHINAAVWLNSGADMNWQSDYMHSILHELVDRYRATEIV